MRRTFVAADAMLISGRRWHAITQLFLSRVAHGRQLLISRQNRRRFRLRLPAIFRLSRRPNVKREEVIGRYMIPAIILGQPRHGLTHLLYRREFHYLERS